MAKECYICEEGITDKEFMVLRQNGSKETFGYVHHQCLAQAADKRGWLKQLYKDIDPRNKKLSAADKPRNWKKS